MVRSQIRLAFYHKVPWFDVDALLPALPSAGTALAGAVPTVSFPQPVAVNLPDPVGHTLLLGINLGGSGVLCPAVSSVHRSLPSKPVMLLGDTVPEPKTSLRP
ncbi:hypothetical protein P692DRAFT_20879804 [Suillus brevipes Sb2]|nr:hypothetical protein P692DRAFT_20879804 [Suillus brevipes Sb2]